MRGCRPCSTRRCAASLARQLRQISCASTTDVRGSPDPPLLKDNHSTLPARRFRVRSALRQTTRSTRRRTHPPVSTVSGPGEESVAFHFHPGGMCPPVLLYPYTEPENPH